MDRFKNYGLYGQDCLIQMLLHLPIQTLTVSQQNLLLDGLTGKMNCSRRVVIRIIGDAVSGGGQDTQFYTSLSYTKQDGIIQNQGLERFAGNANLTHTFNRLTVQVTSSSLK